MKHFLALSIVGLLSFQASAVNETRTKSATIYEKSRPVTDYSAIEEDNSEYDSDWSFGDVENKHPKSQRMEETNYLSQEVIDYDDRTRTNRERKALNTGSHASDDQ